MANSKNRALWGILLLVFIFFTMLIVFSVYTVSALKDSSSVGFIDGKASIAVVELDGIILESKNIVEKLIKAEEDEETKAIILRINSPGGAVGPTQEIYEEVKRIDKEKPVYASFGTVAASGGYYIGAAARKIYSNPGTLTGSIGVIMQFMDLSRLYDFAKMSPETIKAGRYKDIGNSTRGMTKEEKRMMEKLLKGVHKQFIEDIVKVRKKRIKGDMWELAQGQIFSGQDAYNHGLVDELKSLWQAGREIHKELKLEGKFKLKYIKDKKKFSLGEILETIDESVANLKWNSLSTHIPMFISK